MAPPGGRCRHRAWGCLWLATLCGGLAWKNLRVLLLPAAGIDEAVAPGFGALPVVVGNTIHTTRSDHTATRSPGSANPANPTNPDNYKPITTTNYNTNYNIQNNQINQTNATTTNHTHYDYYHHQRSSYDKIFRWDVPPDLQNFDYIPYRQFCRWRNGKIPKKKFVHKTEGWTQVWPSVATNPTPWRVYSNLTENHSSTGGPTHRAPRWLLHVRFDCYGTMKRSPFGTGNWVQMVYLLRLGVAATNRQGPIRTDLMVTCSDTDDHPPRDTTIQDHAESLVMPWLVGHFSSYRTLRFLREAYWKDPSTNQNQNQNQKQNQKQKHNNDDDDAIRVNTDCMETGWGETPVGWMLPFVRQDLRRMAVALVGLPKDDPDHPAHEWHRRQQQQQRRASHQHEYTPDALDPDAVRFDGDRLLPRPSTPTPPSQQQQQPHRDTNKTTTTVAPLLPGVELDEAVVHFRCGDVMVSKHALFRFLKFKEFGSLIFNHTRSIGIVTQSFGGKPKNWWTPSPSSSAFSEGLAAASDPPPPQPQQPHHYPRRHQNATTTNAEEEDEQQRERDHLDGYRVGICRAVVHKFVDYLRERFPHARITIRNGPGETIALAYARLVMAQQAFASPDSSFSVFPTMASFGIGYNMAPVKSLYTRHNPKNQWIEGIAGALSRVDAARDHADGRTELLRIPTKQALYAAQTLQMRKANETTAAYEIVDWFANDTSELRPDPHAVRRFVEHHDRTFHAKRARDQKAPAAAVRMGASDAVLPRPKKKKNKNDNNNNKRI